MSIPIDVDGYSAYRLNERPTWSLEAAYDGRELFARAGVPVITIDAATIRAAVKSIESCEQCKSRSRGESFSFAIAIDG
jgi:hypothetical protein